MRKYAFYDDNNKVVIITRHKRIGMEYLKNVLSQRKNKKKKPVKRKAKKEST